MIKRFLALAAVLLSLVCCAPVGYVLNVEMRQPSLSGDDFVGKEMVVICLSGADALDESTPEAEALAKTLENDYFGGKQTIPIYNMEREAGAVYASPDSLVSLVLETGKDVVFLVDGDNVHYYDAMGSGNMKTIPASTKTYTALKSIWRTESFTVLYYETGEWEDALLDAARMEWQSASDKWIKIAQKSSNNMMKRSCAEYDIALACYMVGNYELALQWLDASDADYPISVTGTLRSRIKKKAGL